MCSPFAPPFTPQRPRAGDTALLNAIWNKYWIATLSASPLLSNASYISAQMRDIADKLESAEGGLSHFGRNSAVGGGGGSYLMGGGERKKDDSQLKKIVRDSSKITREHLLAAMTQAMKHVLFNNAGGAAAAAAAGGASAMDTD